MQMHVVSKHFDPPLLHRAAEFTTGNLICRAEQHHLHTSQCKPNVDSQQRNCSPLRPPLFKQSKKQKVFLTRGN